MRHCVELGYHRSIERYRNSVDTLTKEISKRCFWVAYDIDLVASFILGRPAGISDNAIDVEVSHCIPYLPSTYPLADMLISSSYLWISTTNISHATACYRCRGRTPPTLQPNSQVPSILSSYDNYGPSSATTYILLRHTVKAIASHVQTKFQLRPCARNLKSGGPHLQINWKTFTLARYRCLPQTTGSDWPTTTPYYFSIVTTSSTVQNLLFKCRTRFLRKIVSLTPVTVPLRFARHMRDTCALGTGGCTNHSGHRSNSHGAVCTFCFWAA